VFAQLLEYVEEEHGLEFVDRVLLDADPPSGGAYTSVGTYDASEMVSLVQAIAARTERSIPEFLVGFGAALFPRLLKAHPHVPGRRTDAFSLLEDLHGIIHVEVLKLYPDAELPNFKAERLDDDRMRIEYESSRPFADLAEGLVRGCCRHFGEEIEVVRESIEDNGGRRARFSLTRRQRGA
jgi:hypothetical protein